jgi:hypothetical protein
MDLQLLSESSPQVGIQKAINATCLYNRIDSNIEDYDKPCFSKCSAPAGPTPDNPWASPKMTDCYLACYTAAVGSMSPSELAAPWTKAFESGSAGKGGCSPGR